MNRALIAHGLSAESFTLLSEGVLVDLEASKAFLKLSKRAARAGFDIRIASAFRSYDRQTRIINEKWLGQRVVLNDQGDSLNRNMLTDAQWLEAILRFSALPGTSRHHWGTDLDIWDAAAVDPDYTLSLTGAEYGPGGVFEEMTQWLDARIAEDDAEGFFKPYDRDRGGVAPEPWHISYRPVAGRYPTLLSLELLTPLWTGLPDTKGEAHEPLAMLSVLSPIGEDVMQRYVIIDRR